MNPIEFTHQLRNRQIIIFGTGQAAQKFLESSGIEPEFFVDNNPNKWGTFFSGKIIRRPYDLLQYRKNCLIVVTSMYYIEIAQQLKAMGFNEFEDFIDGYYVSIFMNVSNNQANIIQYPKVINYPVTNKCNYRCVMCNVWKPEHSAHKDLTPDEIYHVFRNPLFKHLEFVGISGGEPFVRKDLMHVIEKIVEALPSLKGMSIISNASIPDMVERVVKIRQFLDQRNIAFTLQISMDGLGEIHDLNRGVAKAFHRTAANFHKLNQLGLVNEISTTITKMNVHHLWDIYRFAREHNVYIRFRIANMINRLYNEDLVDNFMFSEREKLIIIKFLENIIHYYETNIDKKAFYKSLIGMLKGNERKSGCLWQTSEGLSMDPYGNLYFCFPRSQCITNLKAQTDIDLELLYSNQHILKETLKHCSTCIHDYVGPSTLEGAALLYQDIYESRKNYENNTIELNKPDSRIPQFSKVKQTQKVAIVGWYGTETLGDKAILAGIILNLREYGLELEDITLVSLRPQYSQLTLIDLGLEKINLKSAYELRNNSELLQEYDLYIFGGGPLCDVEELVDMMVIFSNAKQLGKMTMIYGCGIGPLNQPRYQEALKRLMRNTDRVCFRDRLSLDKYRNVIQELQQYDEKHCFIDPATNYLRSFKDRKDSPLIQGDYVLFSFRKWPEMYADGLTSEEFQDKNRRFEEQMIRVMEQVMSQGYQVVLMPMHNYFVGDDDREYYLNIAKRLKDSHKTIIISHDYTPDESINYFKHAKYAICMRFHSVVFSVCCNTPCLAIDYHYGKGKVSGFMQLVGLEANLFDFDRWIESSPEKIVQYAQDSLIDWKKVNEIVDQQNDAMKNFMKIELS